LKTFKNDTRRVLSPNFPSEEAQNLHIKETSKEHFHLENLILKQELKSKNGNISISLESTKTLKHTPFYLDITETTADNFEDLTDSEEEKRKRIKAFLKSKKNQKRTFCNWKLAKKS
jgi:hypothetical protein